MKSEIPESLKINYKMSASSDQDHNNGSPNSSNNDEDNVIVEILIPKCVESLSNLHEFLNKFSETTTSTVEENFKKIMTTFNQKLELLNNKVVRQQNVINVLKEKLNQREQFDKYCNLVQLRT